MFCTNCGSDNAPGSRFCGRCGAPLPVSVPAAPAVAGPVPSAAGPAHTLASLGDRALAVILDSLVLAAVFAVLGMLVARRLGGVTGSGFSLEGTPALVTIGLTLLAGFLYYVLLEGAFGTTLGKGILGIAVRRVGGGRCGLGGSLVRNLLRLIDGIGVYLVGFLVAVLSKSRQRLGDLAAGTVVVQRATGRAARAALVVVWVALLGGGLVGAWLLHRGVPVTPAGGFAIADFAFLENKGGPSRPNAPYKPGDTVYTKFTVAGFRANTEGRVDFEVRVTPLDPGGLPLYEPWVDRTAQENASRTMNFTFHFDLPRFAPSGRYRFDIRAGDAVTGAAAVLAPEFGVEGPAVAPAAQVEMRNFRFSSAKDGPAEDPFVTRPGGAVHMAADIAGIQFQQDRTNTRVAFQLIAPDGRVLLDKPDFLEITDSRVYHPPAYYVPMTGWVNLPSDATQGSYTARYTITDQVAAKTVTYEPKFQVQ